MISSNINKNTNRKRRHARVRSKVKGTSEKPRVSVFRSNKAIRVQLIDDEKGNTIVSVNSIADKKKNPTEQSRAIGIELAEKAKKKGVTKAVFDRSGFAYHGRVKEVAEGVREGGLKF